MGMAFSNYYAARKCYDNGMDNELDLKKAVDFINSNCYSSGYINSDLINDYIKKFKAQVA